MMCIGAGVTCAMQYAYCSEGGINSCDEVRCSRDDLLACPNANLADLLMNLCFSGPALSQAIDATSDFSNQFWSHPYWQGVDWQHLKVLGSPPTLLSFQESRM